MPDQQQTSTYNALVGINQAAQLTKRSKGQISQDTKSGRLSYQVDERGFKRYMVSELDRLYGLKTGQENGLEIQERPLEEASKTPLEVVRLEERLTAKEEALKKAEEYIRDLQQSRDKLLEQNTRLTLLLTAPPQTPEKEPLLTLEPASSPAAPVKPSWWKRLFT